MSEVMDKPRTTTQTLSRQEIESTLDRVFDAATRAVNESTNKKVTLQSVDLTLHALFDAIKQAQTKGAQARIPDFLSLIGSPIQSDQ